MNDNINLEEYDRKKVILGFYGFFYVLLLVLIVIGGWVYLGNLEYFSRNKIIPLTLNTDTAKTTTDLPVIKGVTTPPVDLAKETVSTPEKIAAGKTLFDANCVTCHGAEGKGDGIAGKTLNPPPRNFTVLTGWTNGPAFSKMYKTLHEGITARGMASYNNLRPEERINIIHYIRTFNTGFPPIDPNEIKEVDKTYSLSAGVKLPNQIPVKMAIDKLIEEKSVKSLVIPADFKTDSLTKNKK
jgi:mono/diheme cytochrome c family protein